jgi:hypothetical protein
LNLHCPSGSTFTAELRSDTEPENPTMSDFSMMFGDFLTYRGFRRTSSNLFGPNLPMCLEFLEPIQAMNFMSRANYSRPGPTNQIFDGTILPAGVYY